jgi:hypothetical protein
MTDVSLEFVSRQLDRVLDRLGAIEDQITVLTGMTMRHDGSLAGLAVEIRGLMQSVSRVPSFACGNLRTNLRDPR